MTNYLADQVSTDLTIVRRPSVRSRETCGTIHVLMIQWSLSSDKISLVDAINIDMGARAIVVIRQTLLLRATQRAGSSFPDLHRFLVGLGNLEISCRCGHWSPPQAQELVRVRGNLR